MFFIYMHMLCDSNSGIRAQVKIAEDKEIAQDKELMINKGLRSYSLEVTRRYEVWQTL